LKTNVYECSPLLPKTDKTRRNSKQLTPKNRLQDSTPYITLCHHGLRPGELISYIFEKYKLLIINKLKQIHIKFLTFLR